jgi:hypothetical protein
VQVPVVEIMPSIMLNVIYFISRPDPSIRHLGKVKTVNQSMN